MKNCVYCGGKINEGEYNVKISKRNFIACSSDCSEKAKKYVNLDKKYKKNMYLGIFLPCIIILLNLMFSSGLKLVYLMQAVVGIVFLLFPYPNNSLETFNSISIKKIRLVCSVLGLFFFGFGLFLAFSV